MAGMLFTATTLAQDITTPVPLPALANPRSMVLFSGTTYGLGSELYMSDGTGAGTGLLLDINPGPASSRPSGFTDLGGGRTVFSASTSVAGRELWVTDGTAAGTALLKDIATGSASSSPIGLHSLGDGRALFAASNGRELWITNGTTAGTTLLRDFATSAAPFNPAGSDPAGFVRLGNGRTLFSAGDSLWTTDGTIAGTVPVLANPLFPIRTTSSLFVALEDGRALFTGYNGTTTGLWITDGTAAGTKILSANGASGIVALGNSRAGFFASTMANGMEPWITDGTVDGTRLLRDIAVGPGSSINDLGPFNTQTAALDGRFLFGTNSARFNLNVGALWISDGTDGGTLSLSAQSPTSITPLGNGRAVFAGYTPETGSALFVTNGTSAGTTLLRDVVSGTSIYIALSSVGLEASSIAAIGNGRAMFRAGNAVTGQEIWVTDGTTDGTMLVSDLYPGAASSDATGFTSVTFNTPKPAPTPTPVTGIIRDGTANTLFIGSPTRGDMVVVDNSRRGAEYTLLATGDVQLTRGARVDLLRGVEEMRFLDGRMVFDAADPAAAVARLYQAGLGRVPDQGGLNFWIGNIAGGVPLADLATGFLSSPEFTARFGTDLANQVFVTRIYQNVLGRDPEAGGLAFWTGNLDSNAATRGQTLAGISESAENKISTAALVSAGIWDRSEAARSVARLYDTALGRLPDPGGLGFWTQAIEAGTGTLTDLAQAFVTSPEFVATYGALANRAFVEKVYGNTLGRAGDTDGVDFWTRTLDNGTSRATVTIGFSESQEHQNRVAANTGGEVPSTYGIKLA